jgi:hypothetical protein
LLLAARVTKGVCSPCPLGGHNERDSFPEIDEEKEYEAFVEKEIELGILHRINVLPINDTCAGAE